MNTSTLTLLSTIATASLLTLTLAQSGSSFRSIPLPDPNERVTGVYCASAKSCVVATNIFGGAGHLYATDGQTITSTILTGDGKLAESLGTLGTVNFMGFSKVGDRLIVHVEGAGASFVSAKGDLTQASLWTAVKIGTVADGGSFGLNQQMGVGTKDGRWLHFTFRNIYESTDEPGPGALWMPLWSPVSPSVPKNFADLRKADPRLCDTDPGVSISPRLTQAAYVAPDLSVVLYPSGARNQRGTQTAGVCVSTDGAKRFSLVAFKGLEDGLGPLGVTCVTSSRCVAYGGLDSAAASIFIYVTNDVQKGADSSWVAAKLPTLREDSKFRHVAFASGGERGWAVGASGSANPLVLETSDGGATWKDVTASIRALVPNARLHAVYAVDDVHVWIGGEGGTLLASGN